LVCYHKKRKKGGVGRKKKAKSARAKGSANIHALTFDRCSVSNSLEDAPTKEKLLGGVSRGGGSTSGKEKRKEKEEKRFLGF